MDSWSQHCSHNRIHFTWSGMLIEAPLLTKTSIASILPLPAAQWRAVRPPLGCNVIVKHVTQISATYIVNSIDVGSSL